ncbi:hypothetical protein [uncultured Methanomethylovorans sp.]|uniref:hypothetical protein n=1 Tax=uncultured Methanomethylovorans sp. TaxID=183759 RepID=UPI002AA8CFAC|nr:hypothetical protein [uncultured Methanomethylovorans sp.]
MQAITASPPVFIVEVYCMIEIEITKKVCNNNITLRTGASRNEEVLGKIEELENILKEYGASKKKEKNDSELIVRMVPRRE